MTVTCISVSVSILDRAKDLTFIYPHTRCKVRVSYIHTLIKHSNNDLRTTCTLSPGTLGTDICTCSELSHLSIIKKILKGTVIVKVPLESVERILCCSLCCSQLAYKFRSKRLCLLS